MDDQSYRDQLDCRDRFLKPQDADDRDDGCPQSRPDGLGHTDGQAPQRQVEWDEANSIKDKHQDRGQLCIFYCKGFSLSG
jgi:hypothetical protein